MRLGFLHLDRRAARLHGDRYGPAVRELAPLALYEPAGAADRLTSDGVRAYTWDDADRLIGRGSDTFSYDPLHRLTASTVSGTSRSYAYNADGLLASRTQGASTSFLWDPSVPLARLVASGTDNVIYGLGPLYVARGDGTTLTLARDGSKNVRAELDAAGNVVASFRYSAYGQLEKADPAAATPYLLGFASQLQDPSGLVYMRARWYDPFAGRFTTRDPLRGDPAAPTTLNAFGYANANPIVLDDPSGQCAFICGAGIGLGAYMLTIVAINLSQGRGLSVEGWDMRDAAFATATGALTQGVSGVLAVRGATLATRVVSQGAISAASTAIQDVTTKGDVDPIHEYVTTATSTAGAFAPGGSALAHAVAVGLTTNTASGMTANGAEVWIESELQRLVDDIGTGIGIQR